MATSTFGSARNGNPVQPVAEAGAGSFAETGLDIFLNDLHRGMGAKILGLVGGMGHS